VHRHGAKPRKDRSQRSEAAEARSGDGEDRAERNRGGKPGGGGRPGGKGKFKKGKGPSEHRSGGKERNRAPEKPLDPDSPFAKLAALKADLEKRKGGG